MNEKYLKNNIYDLDRMVDDKELEVDESFIDISTKKIGDYFFKPSSFFVFEILCEMIAKKLGIDVLHYDLASYDGVLGLVSKNFKDSDSAYMSEMDLNYLYYSHINTEEMDMYYSPRTNSNSLLFVWHSLEDYLNGRAYKEENVKELMGELTKRFCFDLLTLQIDRNEENTCFKDDGNNLSLVPLFDNELSFRNNILYKMGVNDDFILSREKVISEFCKTTDSDTLNSFLTMINSVSVEDISSMLDSIKDKYGEKLVTIYSSLWYSFVEMNNKKDSDITYQDIKSALCLMFSKNKRDILKMINENIYGSEKIVK